MHAKLLLGSHNQPVNEGPSSHWQAVRLFYHHQKRNLNKAIIVGENRVGGRMTKVPKQTPSLENTNATIRDAYGVLKNLTKQVPSE